MKREEVAFLLDLKALMEHAILHQQSGSKFDMRLGVNHAHQAVELSLRKKAELLGKNPFYFPEVLKTLKDNGVKIPFERQAVELNEARRLTLHYGTTPNDNDARRLIFVAKDFLIDFWKEAFEVNYDDISMVELITNDEVRELLKEAEKTNDYEQAIVKSVLAIYKVKWWIEGRFRGKATLPPFMSQEGPDGMLSFILDVALSSPFAYKLWKLGESTGIIFLPIPGGEPVMQQLKQREFIREDAVSALELAIEYSLWAEHAYS